MNPSKFCIWFYNIITIIAFSCNLFVKILLKIMHKNGK